MDNRATTLYVSDMDGTLLNDRSRVSERSASLLNAAIARGALFTVATARTNATAVPLLSGVDIRLPLIVMAGAAMWHPVERRYSGVRAFSRDTLAAILRIMAEHDLFPLVYFINGNSIDVRHHGTLHAAEVEFIEERRDSGKRFHLADRDLLGADGEAAIVFSMNDYARLERAWRQLVAKTDCRANLSRSLTDSGIGELEIYPAGTSKSEAIARLAGAIGARRVVAFGDNVNDIDMLQAADEAIAVSNAIDEVKHCADRVIGPNNDDSVARYISLNA